MIDGALEYGAQLPKGCVKCGKEETFWDGPAFSHAGGHPPVLRFRCANCGYGVYTKCADNKKEVRKE